MRKTQADRRTETQNALLDATIECLIEHGYASTTTRLVAETAGVSRGAQTHHYPTKSSLVVAAVEHLFANLAKSFVESFESMDPRERTLDHALSMLWQLLDDRTYAAVLELIVASRTDPELQVVVQAVAARLEATVLEIFSRFFPQVDNPDGVAAITNVGFALVQGAALSRYSGFGEPESVVSQMRALISLINPGDLGQLLGASRFPTDSRTSSHTKTKSHTDTTSQTKETLR